ncbi:MAG: PP2C family protein-serine/threonine phosphatase, partial [Acidimicrobiales bacterium]
MSTDSLQEGTGARTLLLIEDDREDALLVQALLEDAGEGHHLVWAPSLEEALPNLAAGPDCVLLDLGLPDAEGADALGSVIVAAPDAAVVVLTGLADESLGLEAISKGAQDYLVKGGSDGRMLARSIRYATERKRAGNTARRLHEAELRSQENVRLERGLLPRPLLRTDTVMCMTLYRPGGEQALLGGDFFDVVELEDGTVRAMIGDVAGHGPDEAALGVRLRVAWRTLVLAGVPPEQSFVTLQDLLLSERPGGELFVTVCEVEVESDRSAARVCLAGHPCPVVVSDRKVVPLEAQVGPPLGVLAEPLWRASRVSLGKDWSILLYTDGLIENIEVTDPGGGSHRLDSDELAEVVEASSLRGESIQQIVQETLGSFEGTRSGMLTDDVAIVALAPLHSL